MHPSRNTLQVARRVLGVSGSRHGAAALVAVPRGSRSVAVDSQHQAPAAHKFGATRPDLPAWSQAPEPAAPVTIDASAARVVDGVDALEIAEDSAERGSFREFWTSDHSAPTLENMMLDSNAGNMDRLERPEILSRLPSLVGKHVLELGAGIGRFSGTLASKAQHVTAVDFVEASCEENRRAHQHLSNISVLQADVTHLQMEAGSMDVVFSNWLLMYLTDSEVRNLARAMIDWLKPGGVLFFRESCFHASGDAARRFNPTQYRAPDAYSELFSEAVGQDGSRLQLTGTNCVESYARMKNNTNQMWFRWEKIAPDVVARRMRTARAGQHTLSQCLRYERICGRGYIVTGGREVSQKLLERCAVPPRGRVLDIGAGLLGTALHFAEQREDIFVHAVNHTSALGTLASSRHVRESPFVRERVSLEISPELGVPEHELRYPPNTFDAIVVRENLMLLQDTDKPVLLQKFARLLKPGGRLVVLDYTTSRPSSELNPHLQEHLSGMGYCLNTQEDEAALIGQYFEVSAEDDSDSLVRYLKQDLASIEDKFGTSAPARQLSDRVEAELQLETLRQDTEGRVTSLFPRLTAEAASEVARAAAEKATMYLDAQRADAEVCAADHKWAQHSWNVEQQAALAGDLRWSYFVAVKKSAVGV